MPLHIRKGDTVVITAGDLRAKYPSNPAARSGKVLEVNAHDQTVVVEHSELIQKKHVRPSQQNPQGGVVEKYRPLHMSNVSPLVDGRASRVRFEKKADGSKIRKAAVNNEQIGPPLKKAK